MFCEGQEARRALFLEDPYFISLGNFVVFIEVDLPVRWFGFW